MGGSFWGLLAPLFGGVLGFAAAVTPEPPPHLLAEVLTCQRDTPSLDLSLTLDGQRLYGFDFPGSRWLPGLPELPPLPPDLETPAELRLDVKLCQDVLGWLGPQARGVLPEARGTPVAQVFPVLPPALGEANTLVCLVENVFPPALDITWTRGGVPLTQGVTQGPFTPTPELTFWTLSHLEVTPERGDVFACLVTPQGYNTSVVTYWDTFVVQVASECPVVATNGSFGLTLLFNKLPLVCVDPQGPPKFVPCAGGGPLENVGAKLADTLNGDPRWGERLQKRGGVCTQLPPKVWGDTALRRVPPKIRVVPSATGNARTPLVLTCHVWGFYPPELNLAWLRNGLLLDDPQGPPGTPPIVPMGSWTYRSEGTLEVPPPEPGDTFTCSVQHPSLQQPLLEDWGG